MPPPRTPPPRALLASVLAASAFALLGDADGRAASVVVTVGDRATTFTADQLAAMADVAANDWQPEAGGDRHPDAVALRRLIESGGGDPATVGSLAIATDGGPAVELTGRELEEPPPFGGGPPIPLLLWADADGIHFARPVGRQLLDRLDVAAGATMTVAVSGGATLAVRVRPSASRVEAGAPLTLTAVVDDLPAGRIAYRWDLGDGRRARGPQLQHAFRRPGRYAVTATATSAGATGTSAPVEIVVGRAPRAPEPEPARREPASPATGADAGGRGAAGAADPGRSSSSSIAPGAAAPEPPAAPAPVSRPARASTPTAAGDGETDRRERRERATAPPTVSGELLASAVEPPPASASSRSPAAHGAAGGSAGEGRLANVPWQAIAVLSLFAGGAFIEWRCGRRGVMP
jgi:hypothetical protein